MREAGLGITHRRGRVVFNRAEVALAVHKLLAHRPRLRHVHERRIDHRLAVRMVVTGGVTADLRALDVLAPREQRQVFHRIQDAALRRLQSIAHIGQRARDDDRHRVIQERVLNFVRDVNFLDFLALRVKATGLLLLWRLVVFSIVWHGAGPAKKCSRAIKRRGCGRSARSLL